MHSWQLTLLSNRYERHAWPVRTNHGFSSSACRCRPNGPMTCSTSSFYPRVLYFLCPADIVALAGLVSSNLDLNGVVVLVNWRGVSSDPCTGDEAANLFMEQAQSWLEVRKQDQNDHYRLDVLYRR